MTDRLREMRARESRATPGPWRIHIHRGMFKMVYTTQDVNGTRNIADTSVSWNAEDNAYFIAHARADIPALLTVVEAAVAWHKAKEAWLVSWNESWEDERDEYPLERTVKMDAESAAFRHLSETIAQFVAAMATEKEQDEQAGEG